MSLVVFRPIHFNIKIRFIIECDFVVTSSMAMAKNQILILGKILDNSFYHV